MTELPPQVAQKELCEECGELASPTHRTSDDDGNRLEPPVFKGWFCANCGYLTKPIRREHGLEMGP